MLGYAAGPRVGAAAYDLAHTYVGPTGARRDRRALRRRYMCRPRSDLGGPHRDRPAARVRPQIPDRVQRHAPPARLVRLGRDPRDPVLLRNAGVGLRHVVAALFRLGELAEEAFEARWRDEREEAPFPRASPAGARAAPLAAQRRRRRGRLGNSRSATTNTCHPSRTMNSSSSCAWTWRGVSSG